MGLFLLIVGLAILFMFSWFLARPRYYPPHPRSRFEYYEPHYYDYSHPHPQYHQRQNAIGLISGILFASILFGAMYFDQTLGDKAQTNLTNGVKKEKRINKAPPKKEKTVWEYGN